MEYLKTDEDLILKKSCIVWAKQMEECFFVCTKSHGCSLTFPDSLSDTHKICKNISPLSYDYLNSKKIENTHN